MPERKTFHYDENEKSPECIRYLKELPTNLNPFDCPYLRVLPEDMIVKHSDNHSPPSKYKEGDLMCIGRAEHAVSRRCEGLLKPRINQEGNLVAFCDWPLEGEIVLKLGK